MILNLIFGSTKRFVGRWERFFHVLERSGTFGPRNPFRIHYPKDMGTVHLTSDCSRTNHGSIFDHLGLSEYDSSQSCYSTTNSFVWTVNRLSFLSLNSVLEVSIPTNSTLWLYKYIILWFVSSVIITYYTAGILSYQYLPSDRFMQWITTPWVVSTFSFFRRTYYLRCSYMTVWTPWGFYNSGINGLRDLFFKGMNITFHRLSMCP